MRKNLDVSVHTARGTQGYFMGLLQSMGAILQINTTSNGSSDVKKERYQQYLQKILYVNVAMVGIFLSS